MKKLPAYIMVIALLVMNLASVAHADCTDDMNCAAVQSAVSVDDAGDHQQDEQKSAACDCCATCGHHHHTHAAMSHTKAEHFADISKTQRSWDGGATYLSQLHYPPSKPPKA